MESMLSGLFLAFTGFIYLLVAFLASKGVKTQSDYLLGNRSFNTTSITLTLIATQLGAGMIFGTAQESYDKGIWGLAYNLGMALGFIILGLGVGARLRSLNINTTAQLFETKFGSPNLRKLAALISIFTMGGILAAQIVASRQLFSSLFDLSPWWLIGFWLVVITYTMFGGIKAVIATDILQVILIVVVFIGVLFLIIPAENITTLISMPSMPVANPSFDGNGIFTVLLVPVLFSLIEQDLAQRFFAAKNRRVATTSALLAGGFLLIFAAIPMLLGMYAKSSGIMIGEGQSPLVLLLQSKLSSFGMTVVACALLAAICSTADSLLGAASSNLIADFGKPNGRSALLSSRIITFLVGILALLVAFYFDNVIGVLLKSYSLSVSALLLPLLIAMFAKTPSANGAKLSVVFGFISYTLIEVGGINISAILTALIISGIAYFGGYFYDRSRA